jgi:hypothetical protein
MAIITIADRVHAARKLHQDAVRFASEFWEVSDLLSCLAVFVDHVSAAEIGADSTGLEIGVSLRRLLAEKCLARWGTEQTERFSDLSQALYELHTTLHASLGVVTPDVRAAALLVKNEIEFVRPRDSL